MSSGHILMIFEILRNILYKMVKGEITPDEAYQRMKEQFIPIDEELEDLDDL